MKKICTAIDDDVVVELTARNKKQGVSKTWMINEALKTYLGMKLQDRLYLDISDNILSVLRLKCMETKQTINEIANELIKKGLENASDKQ